MIKLKNKSHGTKLTKVKKKLAMKRNGIKFERRKKQRRMKLKKNSKTI